MVVVEWLIPFRSTQRLLLDDDVNSADGRALLSIDATPVSIRTEPTFWPNAVIHT